MIFLWVRTILFCNTLNHRQRIVCSQSMHRSGRASRFGLQHQGRLHYDNGLLRRTGFACQIANDHALYGVIALSTLKKFKVPGRCLVDFKEATY